MTHNNIQLHNIADIVETAGEAGFTICRLPLAILDQINPGAQRMATHASGCEIRGMLAPGGEARVTLKALDGNVVPPVAIVLHGSFCSQAVHVGFEPTEIIIKQPKNLELMQQIATERKLPFDPRLVRICLPAIHPMRVVKIEGDLTMPSADATPAKTLLCYGSSITHGASAVAPSGTYAAQCAHRLGYELINLGFGGSAHMDAAIAEHIATRGDWHVATFEMGINVRGWPVEKFYAAVDNFVSTVVKACPDKLIFCIDMFMFSGDFAEDPPKAPLFRAAVKEIAGKMGSERVVHVDGRDILRNPAGLYTDLVHPSDNGMIEMGENLAALIKQRVE